MDFYLLRSVFDPRFVEIRQGDSIIQELETSLAIRNLKKRFSSLEDCLEWLKREEMRLAKAMAYRLLAGRQYGRAALEKKLLQKNFSRVILGALLDELEKLGYLNDADLSERIVEKEFAKGYGPMYIELKLRSLGMNPQVTRLVIDRQCQITNIKKLIQKHRKKAGRSLVSFLARRGFDSDCISEALRELKNSLESS